MNINKLFLLSLLVGSVCYGGENLDQSNNSQATDFIFEIIRAIPVSHWNIKDINTDSGEYIIEIPGAIELKEGLLRVHEGTITFSLDPERKALGVIRTTITACLVHHDYELCDCSAEDKTSFHTPNFLTKLTGDANFDNFLKKYTTNDKSTDGFFSLDRYTKCETSIYDNVIIIMTNPPKNDVCLQLLTNVDYDTFVKKLTD